VSGQLDVPSLGEVLELSHVVSLSASEVFERDLSDGALMVEH
jgi:hypothetical protein